MLLKKLTYWIVLGTMLLFFAFSSCTGESDTSVKPEGTSGHDRLCIRWNVKTESLKDSRALVEDNIALQNACMPGTATGGKAIGIWSAYVLEGETTKNVLGNPNGDVSLVYYAEVPKNEEGVELDNWEGWLYGDTAVYWTPKAKYTFNAYFPKSVIREISSSDVSTFVVEYNTENYQEDLMMAYAYVDTEADTFNSKEPVVLNMLHTLSAIKFQFMFMNDDNTTYEDSDKLTACWLENTLSKRGLATTGVLAFGTKTEGGMDGEHIHWYNEDHPEPSTEERERKIYAWEDAEGVAFNSTTSSCNAATSHSTGNQKYSGNDGWILIIPQEKDITTQLCFKLQTTGDLVHRVNLPEATYEPGKRYTYSIRFGQSGLTLKLSIADWNELKSSHNIPL